MDNDAVFNELKILSPDAGDRYRDRQPLLHPAARLILERIWDKVIGLVVPLILVVIWETVAQLKWIKPVFLPAPSVVFQTFINLLTNDHFLGDIWVSVYTVIRGFSWGLGLGLIIGAGAGMSRTIDRLFGPLLNAIRQVPPIAWLPLILANWWCWPKRSSSRCFSTPSRESGASPRSTWKWRGYTNSHGSSSFDASSSRRRCPPFLPESGSAPVWPGPISSLPRCSPVAKVWGIS
jgi:hypothetical protein